MPSRYRHDERDPTGAAPGRRAHPRSPGCESCDRPLTRWTTTLGGTRCTSCVPARPAHPDREPVPLAEALRGAFDEVARTVRTAPLVPAQRTTAAGSPAHTPGASPVAPYTATATCRRCGGEATWHPTVRGRWILIEPGDWSTGSIPAGKRWRIAGDGTAVNLGPANPHDTCRISHFDICPDGPAPHESPVLLTLWRRNRGRAS